MVHEDMNLVTAVGPAYTQNVKGCQWVFTELEIKPIKTKQERS